VHRIVLLGTAAAAVAATIGPVQAGPAPVDAGRVAVADLTFHLRHGQTLSLDVRAGALSGGNSLRVIAQRCHADGSCDPSTDAYQSQLAAAALTIDPSTAVAELRTTIAGHALHIRWQPDGSTFNEVGGFEAQGGGLGTSGSEYDGSPAVSNIELDDRSCNGTGAVGTGAFADTSPATGSPDYAPLSALHIPATAPLTCG
jgi:hypothetical protein